MSERAEIPLFPLSSVLVPYGRMALQIFEQRYLDLVRSCMREGSGFGVVWLRAGREIAGGAAELGDYGTFARIVDWDQLPNGLLGLTIEGGERFELHRHWRLANELNMGEVTLGPPLAPVPMSERWEGLARLLEGLEAHPHVQRLALPVDRANAAQIGGTLLQLLPVEESEKYRLLGLPSAEALLAELDRLLNEISGAD
ncbi:MAG TPA: ATP-dependent protease [Halieaceae bacterium]|nr:ATP-dependent protease [Halieaceae bacterium]